MSSDTAGARTLTALGFGELASGSLAWGPLAAPRVSVTVRSDAKGEVVLPVEVTGNARAPIPVAAQAGADQTVHEGQKLVLDGSASSGPVSTYSWSSPSGVVLSDPTRPGPASPPPRRETMPFPSRSMGPVAQHGNCHRDSHSLRGGGGKRRTKRAGRATRSQGHVGWQRFQRRGYLFVDADCGPG